MAQPGGRAKPTHCDARAEKPPKKLAHNTGSEEAVVAPRAGATKGSGVAKTSSRSGSCATKAVLRCELGKAGRQAGPAPQQADRQAGRQAGRAALFSAA